MAHSGGTGTYICELCTYHDTNHVFARTDTVVPPRRKCIGVDSKRMGLGPGLGLDPLACLSTFELEYPKCYRWCWNALSVTRH